MNNSNITVLVLAGGDSDRFWPLAKKPFFKIMGKELIYYSLKRLHGCGINKFVIIHNKNNISELNKFMQNNTQFNIHPVLQSDPRGMAGAVLSASKFITKTPLLIIGPEETYNDELVSVFEKNVKDSCDVLISGYKTEKYIPAGYLKTKANRVESIVEKPGEDNIPGNLVNIVFHFHKNPDILIRNIKEFKGKSDDLYEKAINRMIDRNFYVNYFEYSGYWSQVKYPWQILDVVSFYLGNIERNIGNNVKISDGVKIEGKVVIEDGAKIMENSVIIGPSYIGKNSLIGQNVLIRNSIIEENCVIGFSSEIARSHIGRNCWFHKNYIGDSVVDQNVAFGAGSLTANFKLDESSIGSQVDGIKVDTNRYKFGAVIGKNSRIGVNSSVMPGVKIGKGCFIGASTVVQSDTGDYSLLYTAHKNVIKKNRIKVNNRT